MSITLSRYFKISAVELRKRGVLNAHLGIDNRLFVDPNLLKATKIPELKDARADLEKYFVPVIRLLKASKKEGDIAWTAAKARLIFKEEHGTALGYAGAGGLGKAIGPDLADILVKRGKQIVDLGIDAAEMFGALTTKKTPKIPPTGEVSSWLPGAVILGFSLLGGLLP